MANRPTRRKRRILKTTIDSFEIGHDLIDAMVEQFLTEGCSEATAVRKLIFLGALVKSGKIAADDTLKQLLSIGDNYPAREARVSVSAPNAAPRSIESQVQSTPAPRSPIPVTTPEHDRQALPERQAALAVVEKPDAVPQVANSEKPRGMLAGLRGMMATQDLSASPSQEQLEAAHGSAGTQLTTSNVAKPVQQVRAIPVSSSPEEGQVQSPAAIANALAARRRANGREF